MSGEFVNETAQLAGVRRLIAEVAGSNRFQAGLLASAGAPMLPSSLDDFHRRFPLTTKADLVRDQEENPPYGTNLTFPIDRYTRCHQTSGTTGRPLRWLDTPESWGAMVDDWVEVLRAAGVRPGSRVFFAFSFGPFLGFWLAFEAGQRLGCLCFAGGGMSSAVRGQVMDQNACEVLCCTPTYALHLAEVARREGRELRSIRLIVVAGEPGGSVPSVRQLISNAWFGARVFDHHGMTEVGPVTHEDTSTPGNLVVLDRSFLAEVTEPGGTALVPDGCEGELVLTTLRRTASPLIRYRTGDLVRRRIQNGRTVLEGGILGRVDDMLIVRGVNVYPSAVEALIRAVAGAAEYRVFVEPRGAMKELRIELEGDPGLAQKLERRLGTDLGLRLQVASVPVGTLPRFEHKAARWCRS